MRKSRDCAQILRQRASPNAKMLTANKRCTYLRSMQQTVPGGHTKSAGGGAMSKAATAKDRVDSALSRLETMVDERLQQEKARGEELTQRLARLEQQHEQLKKVAAEVEGRLERAMEYIRSLLAADQQ